MGKLSDILKNGQADNLKSDWDSTEAANEFSPLSPGEYIAHVASGELFRAKTGTPGFKLTFRVAEGDYIGRRCWADYWLTRDALPLAKRDLAKIGVTSLEQLEKPVPRGIRCKIKVALHKSDSGAEYNVIRSFSVIGIDPPEQDAFAPSDDGSTPSAEETGGPEAGDPGATPAAAADAF